MRPRSPLVLTMGGAHPLFPGNFAPAIFANPTERGSRSAGRDSRSYPRSTPLLARAAFGPPGLVVSPVVLLLLAFLAGCGPSPTSPTATATITAQPADQSATEGTSATFTVVATNASAYTWQRSPSGGATFVDIAGATSPTYTTPATVVADNGYRFRVVVSGAGNSVTSSAARLSVTAAPVAPAITGQPTAQNVVAGTDATFSVTATGTSLAYQWQRSTDGGSAFANLAGATNATHVRTAVPISDNGHQFRVVVTNVLGSVVSDPASLTVTAAAPPLAITTPPQLLNGTTNMAYSVTLAATGGTPPYMWSLVSGALPTTMSLNSATGVVSGTPTAAGSYNLTVRVEDASAPKQFDERSFDLVIQAPCDQGFGELTVGGAPNTVGGRFCPEMGTGEVGPNVNGVSYVLWTETYPYGSGAYAERIMVQFEPATGNLLSVSFNLNDPTRLWTYLCVSGGSPDYPACAGVTVNPGGSVRFEDAVVSSGPIPGFTLNGELRF